MSSRPSKRLFAAAFALVAVGSIVATASPGATQTGAPIELQLLTFNDYHGHLEPPGGTDGKLSVQQDPAQSELGGAEYLATTLKSLRAGRANTLTATAGDLIGGSPFLSGLFHDEPSVESLESLGLNVSGVGNHEFDEGLTELVRMQYGGCHPVDGCYVPGEPYDGAQFPWLAANVVYTKTGRNVLAPFWVTNVGGKQVGFIGMTLEGTPELVAESGIQGLTFQDEVAAADRTAVALDAWGVHALVVLLHEGGVQTGTYQACTGISDPIATIAKNMTPLVDVLVTGHTHQPYICSIPDPAGQPRIVTSAASYGRLVTETRLSIDATTGEIIRASVSATNDKVLRTVAKDADQSAIISKWKTIAGPIGNRVVGTISSDLLKSPNRDTESSLGNLIADAQLDATSGAPANAQIVLMNPGGVRADLTVAQISGGEQPGEVTYGEAFAVQPFGNLLVTVTMTGAKVEEALEQQYVSTRSRKQLILGVSRGLTFDFVTNGPEGDRVRNIKLNGVAVDPTANYQVTVNNFLADGGDGFIAFVSGTKRVGGGDDLAAFNTYLGVHSPVGPAPTDRINEITQ